MKKKKKYSFRQSKYLVLNHLNTLFETVSTNKFFIFIIFFIFHEGCRLKYTGSTDVGEAFGSIILFFLLPGLYSIVSGKAPTAGLVLIGIFFLLAWIN